MRQIIIDIETTGLNYRDGHRIIEIGAIELIDRKYTGKQFHKYINPQRPVENTAFNIHGISNNFLLDKPLFSNIIDDFIEFITGSELIAHNADFDINFINYEIALINNKLLKPIEKYATVFDTLILARKLYPGQKNSLDAICKRYQIKLDNRKLHGALLDAQLLAKAYLLMTGGQSNLFNNNNFLQNKNNKNSTCWNVADSIILYSDNQETKAHQQFITFMKENYGINRCIWDENDCEEQ